MAAPAAALGSWSIQPTPNQPGVANSVLNGISCTSAKMCVAVGWDGNDASKAAGRVLAERWDGQSWSIFPTIASPAAAAQLSSVSCTASSSCIAVGDYQHGRYPRPLTERWNGQKWSILKSPQPAGALGSSLRGVSCTSARQCVAVGYAVTSPRGKELVERWNGHKWSIEATLKAPYSGSGSFSAVSCTSKKRCMAVGSVSIQGPDEAPLAGRWNGHKWALLKPSGAPGARASSLEGVSCTSPRACTAVGRDLHGVYGPNQGFAERWNGQRWSLETLASPFPGPPNPNAAPPQYGLSGVSCASVHACVAVGDATLPLASNSGTLVEQWNGHAWAVVPSPNPAGASSSSFGGVACRSATVCIAVGQSDQGKSLTLAEGS